CDHIHGAIRESDWLFRLGGEEFVLLLRETERDEATRRCEELRLGIARLKIAGNGGALPSVTVSMGLATRQTDGDTLDDILARADD
ncbi:GGDEF domain-containing protein, partial [Klebsiella pneumoniae]|uniref:GGDEF domain-containing protein n=1 Tax=Klebsiella pneumoniae TaxID=573 RepID=UPI003853A281